MRHPANFGPITCHAKALCHPLISLLEGAYHDAKKFQTLKGKSLLIQEAILNIRNFLIITNYLLNPDDDNPGLLCHLYPKSRASSFRVLTKPLSR